MTTCEIHNCEVCSDIDTNLCSTCFFGFELEDGLCDNCQEGFELIQEACVNKKQEKIDMLIGIIMGVVFLAAIIFIAVYVILKNKKKALNASEKEPLLKELSQSQDEGENAGKSDKKTPILEQL